MGILQAQNIAEYSFPVEGLCGMCKETIEKTALGPGGADAASYDLASNILTVSIDHDKVQVSGVRWELAQAGYDNGDFTAPEEAYSNLPGCCQYRMETSHVLDEVGLSEEQLVNMSYVPEIDGYLYELDDNGNKVPLIGATVTLSSTPETGTTSDENGYFIIDNSTAHAASIDIQYVGYETQTVYIDQHKVYDIVLSDGHQLDAVEITYRKRTTEISFVNTLNTEKITREELCKAACCNLSESFETNPSVDVSYSDAVTGARQIQMLGLAGPYVQIGRELIPDVRGLSSIYGLSMTPGPWIEGIQLIKGVGSVVNGYESITGQINVELKKPEAGELLFINGYVSNGGRIELNANGRRQVTKNISSSLLLHGKTMQNAHDRNGDLFTDMPFEKDFVIANRWKYLNPESNFVAQLGLKMSSLNHKGGFHDHFSGEDVDHENHWRMNNNTNRYEAWAKIGYVDQDNPAISIALQMSAVRHDQESSFGFDDFDAIGNYFVSNLIFQYIPEESHTLRAGLSYQLDDVYEFVQKINVFERFESVPGAYAEYTFKKENKFSVIPGIRADYHNNYGLIVTPRLHAKYNFSDNSVVRLVGGKGWRTASIFAENLALFSTNRVVSIQAENDKEETPYGLEAEVAWNYGINYTQGIDIGGRDWILSMDFYRTDFQNQIVTDYETPTEVSFYNLDGQSYSNSFQAKIEVPVSKRFDVRAAYRIFDVKTEFQDVGLRQKPLVAKHRAFINGAYKTDNDWFFDATVNWNGAKRLPSTASNPLEFRRPDVSPDFVLVNAQIMKRWGDKWDVYLGAENLLNYKQRDAIIGAEDPFGQYFDASLVWAPLFGANVYLGFRMTIVE